LAGFFRKKISDNQVARVGHSVDFAYARFFFHNFYLINDGGWLFERERDHLAVESESALLGSDIFIQL
jgi:hypothetical protein